MRWSILWSTVCFCGDWSTCCDLVNIDTAGITALEELHKSLSSHGKQGTQRFLQRLELYASVVMGLEAPALVNGQNLAITYNVFLGNHIVLSNIKYFMLIKHININIHNISM
ncbi:hypothetical protein AAZX31_U007600 [Glycine max]|uniref:uncharacterized protein n=1 Tax=Glycine max TaxID=3847 RepID=UPI001B357E42|nr:uncharacterized protein LOC121173990 [Glycine max]